MSHGIFLDRVGLANHLRLSGQFKIINLYYKLKSIALICQLLTIGSGWLLNFVIVE